MPEHHLFERLHEELRPFRNIMSQASETIIRKDISSYPVFVVYQMQEVQLGIPLVEPQTYKTNWGINASTLEELTARGVISLEKVEQFQSVYKDPEAYLCIFLVAADGGHFAFLPLKDSIV